MYKQWGFHHVDDVQFPEKRYASAVMTLDLTK